MKRELTHSSQKNSQKEVKRRKVKRYSGIISTLGRFSRVGVASLEKYAHQVSVE